MSKLLAVFLFLVALTLAGCQMLNPQQKENVRTTISQMRDDGKISPAQYDALVSALDSGNMSQFWQLMLSTGLGIAGSFFGINFYRGPKTPPQLKDQQIATNLANIVRRQPSAP